MKVYLDTIGCRLNQSEIEKMAAQFRAAGHLLVDRAAEADCVVVNTCAVTAEAASDSRQKIRQAVRAGVGEVLVTGCWSTLEPEAAANLTGVTRVIPNAEKDSLVTGFLQTPGEVFDREPLARQPLPGIHLRTRAFIKVQDGCDNFCTFCVTRIARGRGRSRPASEILSDIRASLAGGAQEIVLSGVHLGSWGPDLHSSLHLKDLIHQILAETDVPRLRLSSLEPWNLDDDFFRLWEDPRLCAHLHLPLQSGSAGVLKRMVRKTTPDAYARILEMARSASPDMAITTDIITGFPGETEMEFNAGLDFVRGMNFAGGHVFVYSARPGTAAARLPGAVNRKTAKARSAVMRAALAESAEAYRQRFSGMVMPVLWESTNELGSDGWRLHGLTANYLKVSAVSPERIWNKITPVRLSKMAKDGFEGEMIHPV